MRSAKKIALPLVVLVSGLAVSAPAWTESDASQRNNDIVVEQLAGAVEVTVAGTAFDARVGSVVGLPSRIVTGSDGNIAIRQSRTGVAIAPDSDVEIPQSARDGQLIARMFQHRGTAFYDVEPRPVEKLRIDTPYLVAVVKGTQFSVLVADGRTTVSLFEGLLELRSIDGAEVVELAAGQIAVGGLGGGIRILPMDADLLPDAAALRQDGATAAPGSGAVAAVAATSDVDAISLASLDTSTSFSIDGGAGVDAEASLSIRGGLSVGDSSPTGAGVGLDTDANVGGGSADVGLDAGLDAGVDLGGGSVDVGLDAGLDAGADVAGGDVTTGLDAGLDASADLGGGSVDVGLDAGLDAGLDSGVAVDADLSLGEVEIEAGLEAGLDLGVPEVEDTLGDLLDPADESGDTGTDTEEDETLLPDLPLPLF